MLAQLAVVGLMCASVASRQVGWQQGHESGCWQPVSQGMAVGWGALDLFQAASQLLAGQLGLAHEVDTGLLRTASEGEPQFTSTLPSLSCVMFADGLLAKASYKVCSDSRREK